MALKWYILHTTPSYENKVVERIRTRAQNDGLADSFGEIIVPAEEIVELKNGKKVTSTRRLFPGYVFAQMDFNDAIWHLVVKTPNVTGFVGAGSGGAKPQPMKDAEIQAIIDRVSKAQDKPAPKILFQKGESVRVIQGPFKDFTAVVDQVDYDKGRMRINVTVFGRETPMEIPFADVEKLS